MLSWVFFHNTLFQLFYFKCPCISTGAFLFYGIVPSLARLQNQLLLVKRIKPSAQFYNKIMVGSLVLDLKNIANKKDLPAKVRSFVG